MPQKYERIWFFVGLLTLGAIVVGLTGARPVRSQLVQQQTPQGIANVVEETVSYQGVLTDPAGEPLNGTFAMRFDLYRAATGGAPVFESAPLSVNVSGGLFHVGLPAPQTVFDGGPLWLSVIINGEVLSPRQQIRPAPYAMSLRPGATVRQVATGTAVRVESTQGIGLQGTGQVYGIYGTNTGAAQGSGYGGYFESTTGIGVYGSSTAISTLTNLYAPGVYGRSQHGVGVFGGATTGSGVYGTSSGRGLTGVGQSHGVFGSTSGAPQGSGYGGYFTSNTGIGVHGRSTAQISGSNLFAPGVYGYSQNGAGVMGEAGSGPGSVAGFFAGNVLVDGNLHIDGNLTATGSKVGYVVDVARNDDTEALAQGDLVVITGVTDPVLGAIPVPLVRKADVAASTAVVGVVDLAYRVDDTEPGLPLALDEAGIIQPGDYLTIVTLGAFQAIKVDASYGAIRPGDLLVSSPTPGHAMRADDPRMGTVIGKALDSLETGTGAIAVMVTLQ
jgi:hypothetical protein